MFRWLCFILLCHGFISAKPPQRDPPSMIRYDSHHVRYELYQTNGGKPYNWLFFPGGPGADSRYLKSLLDELELPGNVWLVDLPGNGDNLQKIDNFDTWIEIFPTIIKQFDHVIVAGHSFGGMFPLLFPELEQELEGFVVLNSVPCLWLKEAVAYSKQFNLPDLTQPMQDFTENPNQETFQVALDACMPYYFPKETLEKGRALLMQVTFQFQAAVWWQRKVFELNFTAKWIPQNVPTLIIGGKYDCICPYTLYQKDKRFKRPNIKMVLIEEGGHLPWMENPAAVSKAFEEFVQQLES